jgi:hypothetical protein
MSVWEFEVGVTTHDDLKRGVTLRHWTRVSAEGRTRDDAALVALQTASCGGWIPTGLIDRF